MPPKFSTPLQRRVEQSRNNTPESAQLSREIYNAETGQIYTEREVVFRKRAKIDWINSRKPITAITKPHRSVPGAASLFETAIFKCIQESTSFTMEHFEFIPWSIAEQIWSKVVELNVDSFALWQTMASVYHRHDEFGLPIRRYYLNIRQPAHSPKDYYNGLTSTDNRWLTALRISPADLAIPDLVAVFNVSNLAVLDLSDGQHIFGNRTTHFDERVMRTWAELASTGRAFKQLRVLMLGWQDSASDWIFKYLPSFARLELLILTDCKNFHQKNRFEWEDTATKYGWHAQHAKKSVKTVRPLLDDKTFHTPTISNFYYQACRIASIKQSGSNETQPIFKPLVEVQLGSPKSWAHIIDEFPGTRTIWLEQIDPYSELQSDKSEHSKRMREVSKLNSTYTPPHERSSSTRTMRQKPVPQSAALLLSDFGIG